MAAVLPAVGARHMDELSACAGLPSAASRGAGAAQAGFVPPHCTAWMYCIASS